MEASRATHAHAQARNTREATAGSTADETTNTHARDITHASTRGVSTPDRSASQAACASRPRSDAPAQASRDARGESEAATSLSPALRDPSRVELADEQAVETAPGLPDVMLALLGFEVAPVATPSAAPPGAVADAGPATAAAAGPLVNGLPGAVSMAVATVAGTNGALAAPTPSAAASGSLAAPIAPVPADARLDAAAQATAIQQAMTAVDATKSMPTGTDAFAAMLATEGMRETGPTDAPTAESVSAFAALGSRGTAETLGLSRSAVVLPPVPMPAVPEDGFDDGFGDRIVWMAEQRLGHAELRVSPDGAGAIDIRLQVDGNRVSAQFNAANPEVRQALESGMDRLRDLLGQHGMELAHSGVGDHRRPGTGNGATTADTDGLGGDDVPQPTTTIRSLRARGLVDEYV
ncbi:flagellar hook-length control protein FliK [Lysobacter humi (ex Lee et al. 2017)]